MIKRFWSAAGGSGSEDHEGFNDLIEQIHACGLHPPEAMTLMVTDGCNLNCRHCWLDCRSLRNAVLAATPKILGVIDAFARLGGTGINLTGGEILSHPDWHRILRHCLDHARINKVCLQTNAALFTRKHLEVLLDMPLDKFTIQVSLDGFRARTHNFVRGPGNYDRVTAALHLLVRAGLGNRTQVAFTEMAHNFHELPQLLEIVDQMGIGRLISSTLVKGGRAAASHHIMLPTPGQYQELINRYETDERFRNLCDQKATISAIEWFKNRSASTDEGCSCIKNLFMDAHGHLYPCTMLLLGRYASESAYSQPLDQVIRKALIQWRGIPVLSRERQHSIPSCTQCAGKNHCRGGCMGRAAISRGILMDPEDRCSLRKAVYLLPIGATLRSG
jgi:radical SAM protein with 4Fe4S-binding SPASM domain